MTRLLTGDTQALDASGNRTFVLGPPGVRQTWHVTRIEVRCTGALVPVCSIYKGEAATPNLIDGTSAGLQDTADGEPVDVAGTHYVTAVWSGGTPSSQATVELYGDLLDADGNPL